MVARGDLGLDVPLERVPRVQKEMTRWARAGRVPVIVATQVLESMRTEPRPTRAEVSDAANAVDDGVDAIMLAGETAAVTIPSRRYAPSTRSSVMRSVAAARHRSDGCKPDARAHGRALCEAAITLASHSRAAAIVAVTAEATRRGYLSSLRPDAGVLAVTEREDVARRLSLPSVIRSWPMSALTSTRQPSRRRGITGAAPRRPGGHGGVV